MATNKQMTADEKRWRAESDADAMARVEEIMSDASRRKMAINVANRGPRILRSVQELCSVSLVLVQQQQDLRSLQVGRSNGEDKDSYL